MTAPQSCRFPGCSNECDPRWGGYCDGHGVSSLEELERRTAAENQLLRNEAERLKADRRRLAERVQQICRDAAMSQAAHYAEDVWPEIRPGETHPSRDRIAASMARTVATNCAVAVEDADITAALEDES